MKSKNTIFSAIHRVRTIAFLVFAIGLAIAPMSPVLADASPANVLFDKPNPAPCNLKQDTVLGIPDWYEYLQGDTVQSSDGTSSCQPFFAGPDDIWLIVAAAFEILLRVAGATAVGFIIYAGFRYAMSQGSPQNIASAKTVLVNAITGLVITVTSARLIGFFAGRFGGSISTTGNTVGLPNVAANASTVSVVTTLVFQVIALIATLFIVWGGITYSRSNGDPGAIKQAKETIIYALLGLIITLFAQAIVGFVLGKL